MKILFFYPHLSLSGSTLGGHSVHGVDIEGQMRKIFEVVSADTWFGVKRKYWNPTDDKVNLKKIDEEVKRFKEMGFDAILIANPDVLSRKETPPWIEFLQKMDLPLYLFVHSEDEVITPRGAEAHRLVATNPKGGWFVFTHFTMLKVLDEVKADEVYIEVPGCYEDNFIYQGYYLPGDGDFDRSQKERVEGVPYSAVATSRITTYYGSEEFAALSGALGRVGIEAHAYGVAPIYQYLSKIQEGNYEGWNYHGEFSQRDLPLILQPSHLHWSVMKPSSRSQAGRGAGKYPLPFYHRTAAASIEAMSCECVPIMMESWVQEGFVDEVNCFTIPDFKVREDQETFDCIAGLLREKVTSKMDLAGKLARDFALKKHSHSVYLPRFKEWVESHG